jgi:hypothetical protein
MRVFLMAGNWATLSCLLLLFACGGQVEGDDADADSSLEDGGDGDENGGDDPDGMQAGDLTLDECELGVPVYEAGHECNWLADDLCYLTKAAACACVCPRDGPSLCLSDFYGGEGSETKVTCRPQ